MAYIVMAASGSVAEVSVTVMGYIVMASGSFPEVSVTVMGDIVMASDLFLRSHNAEVDMLGLTDAHPR